MNKDTLIDFVQWRLHTQPEKNLYTFTEDDGNSEYRLTYAALDEKSRKIGAWLQEMGLANERALLLYPPGPDYIEAFWGCLYAGIIAVPAYPPRLNRPMPRLQAIIKDAQTRTVLTTSRIAGAVEKRMAHFPKLSQLKWLATDAVPVDVNATWQMPDISADSLAFLQYTSGSTASPKGVMLSHANLLHNLSLIQHSFDLTPESQGVIWLPPYHDMGLIGGVLGPMYAGFPVTLMTPMAFLQRPLFWLEAISKYKATVSGGPNFAFDLCVAKSTPEQREGLDLSSWSVAFNGAEPIRPSTLARFSKTFGPYGFKQEAFYPCYGLAEATLIVSGGHYKDKPVLQHFDKDALTQHKGQRADPADGNSTPLISTGQTILDQVIVIAEPQSNTLLPDGEVGEICVSGGSIAQGYWGNADATQTTFKAQLLPGRDRTFLRTGDLGFLSKGELFITGRIKDMLIIRGRNYYPQDIELTAEVSHEALRLGCAAAFMMADGRLAIAQEIKPRYRKQADVEGIARAIRQAVAEEHGLQINTILLLSTGRIPKTSSGKIQRHACRLQYEQNRLALIGQSTLDADTAPVVAEVDAILDELATINDVSERQAKLSIYLRATVAQTLRVSPDTVISDRPLTSLGIDSLTAVDLKNKLENDLCMPVSLVDLLEGKTINQLTAAFAARWDQKSEQLVTIQPVSRAQTLPVSYSQQRLWFMEQMSANNVAYNVPVAMRLKGVLNHDALTHSLYTIIQRHESLRTTFQNQNGKPVQCIVEDLRIKVPLIDLSATPDWEQAGGGGGGKGI